MRIIALSFFTLFCTLSLLAQRGDELLVYAVKGKVTATYQQKVSPVKIGKVLVPGTVIKTEKQAVLTMICTRGQPIQVQKEGTYPVTRWKDSCRINQHSVSGNYFRYIWDQFYSYSPEHKNANRKRNDLAVSRGGPSAGRNQPKTFTKLVFSKGMDTVNTDGTDFNLSWTGTGYRGYYQFTLYDAAERTVLFKDSVLKSFIPLSKMLPVMEPGKTYRWTVFAEGAPISRKRVLQYVPADSTQALVKRLQSPGLIPEEEALSCFRVAYLLEQAHYLAEALRWYQKASELNPEMELFRDQLIRFRNEYWVR